MQYLVVEDGTGWMVRDDEQVVAAAQSLDEAVATAKILALAVKAVGGKGSVMIQDKSGALAMYDLDRA